MEKLRYYLKKIRKTVQKDEFQAHVRSVSKGFGVAGKIFISFLFVILFTGVICVSAFGLYVRKYLSEDASVDVASVNMKYTTVVYYTDSETGELKELERLYGSENRVWVNSEEIPENLKNAFIAIEDERFMSHKGVDWRRTIGATINLVLPYSGNFGGSTITQQLVKNITGDDEVTIQRKVLEILRALDLERRLSKSEILEMYLNTINLSQGCYGVSSAAYVYFGKEVSELDLAECACIAGITNSPTYYDPFQNPDNNKARQELILEKMFSLGMISEEEYKAAVDEVLCFKETEETDTSGDAQSYFTDLMITEITEDLQEELGYSSTMAYKLLYSGGLTIEATVDPEVQSTLEEFYTNRDNFPTVSGTTQLESAMVIMSTDGKLLGIVGGIGQKSGNLVLNRALSERQPGSVIKPVSVYAPAIEYGLITPYSVLDDTPSKYITTSGTLSEAESVILLNDSTITAWPVNSDRTYQGRMTVRQAVAESTNTVAVRVLDMLGLESAFDYATERFGLSLIREETVNGIYCTDLTYSALALGGLSQGVSLLEITAAYVPFVSDGIYTEPTTYTRVYDADGNLILDHSGGETVACSAETAYYVRDMLQYTVENGTASGAAMQDFDVAGKTGTTSNNYDRWFVGMTPYYVAGVWFGFDTNKEVDLSYNPSVSTWKSVMTVLHEDKEPASFETPENLVTAAYCLDSGCIPSETCQNDDRGSRVAYGEFFESDVPTTLCTLHTEVKLCSDTNRICSDYCNRKTATTLIRLNLYRYFAIPNVTVEDESYCVHFDGTVSNRVLTYYFNAKGTDGQALEGSCTKHAAALTTSETTSDGTATTKAPLNTPKVETVLTEAPPETTETDENGNPVSTGTTESSVTTSSTSSVRRWTLSAQTTARTEPPEQ